MEYSFEPMSFSLADRTLIEAKYHVLNVGQGFVFGETDAVVETS